MDERILAKIKKCLAMASDNRGDPNTAAIALRQAQALMREHKVTLAHVKAADVKSASAATGSWTRPAGWELQLAAALCRAFGCKFYMERGDSMLRTFAHVVFLGQEGHVESAGYAYEVIRRVAAEARAAFTRKLPAVYTRGEKMAEGDTFVRGYISNLDKQIQELVLSQETQEAIQLRLDNALGPQPKTYAPAAKKGSFDAYNAGKEGSKLTLHRAAEHGAPPPMLTDAGARVGLEKMLRQQ